MPPCVVVVVVVAAVVVVVCFSWLCMSLFISFCYVFIVLSRCVFVYVFYIVSFPIPFESVYM